MEILRGERVLRFAYLIIQTYQLSQSQDLTNRAPEIHDICEDMIMGILCTNAFPPGPRLYCRPKCPEPWVEEHVFNDTTVGAYGQTKFSVLKATLAWNGTNIFCDGYERPKRVFIRGRHKAILEFANEVMWSGLNQTSSCSAHVPCSIPHFKAVHWTVRCVDNMECAPQVIQRNDTLITVTFNSTAAWNNSLVSCILNTKTILISEQRILTVYAHPTLTSLPAGDFFHDGVNVTFSCFTVEYLPANVDLALNWYCATSSCPGDFYESGSEKITFRATKAWNGIRIACFSKAVLPITLNTINRRINVVNVQVIVNQKSSLTVVGELQLVNCSMIGPYWHIMASHPLHLTVVCPGARCQYITMETQSDKAFVSFVADTTWDGAQVICKLNGSSLPEHEARLTVNVTDMTANKITERLQSATQAWRNYSLSADVTKSAKGIKNTLLMLAFGTGIAIFFMAAFISRIVLLVLCRLKRQWISRSVCPSENGSHVFNSRRQAQSPTSLGMVAETTGK